MSADRIEVACPACGQRTAVAPANLGRKGRCPTCKEIFELRAPVKKPAAPAAAAPADSLWNDFVQPAAPLPLAEASLTVVPPSLPSRPPSMADDYLRRAKEDKPTMQSAETEPMYRFTTSWGSVIGGALMFLGGLVVFVFISFRLGIVMVIAGAGWFIQGLNYVFYYRWKDEQGE